ncbi:hypothetical protein K8R30_04075 [archaeon]|nr:hypothetical protein [archaeon]
MKNKTTFIIGLLIAIPSIAAAFYKINNWYFTATIGIWLIFDTLSSQKNKNTTLQILKKDKIKFFNLYLLMFLLGATIEIVGRFILNLWDYPNINSIPMELAILLFYPFILFSFREMFESIKLRINKTYAFVLSMILGIIIWEIPNLFSTDWVYTIPFTSLNILNINIVVILGWSILIGFPIYLYNIISK